MENLNLYSFIGKVALEYRLSLKNTCRLIRLEPTEENKNKIYNMIIKSCGGNNELINLYKYLFNFETVTEKNGASLLAYSKAGTFIVQYNNAKRSGDSEEMNKALMLLNKTERDFKELMQKDLSKPLTESDAVIIAKYRLKHCVTREDIAHALSMSEDKVRKSESLIQDSLLREKLLGIADYCAKVGKDKYFSIPKTK